MTSYTPLHGPDDDNDDGPASLAGEIRITQQTLTETASLNIHDHTAMIRAAVQLDCRVRGLLAAYEAERGEAK